MRKPLHFYLFSITLLTFFAFTLFSCASLHKGPDLSKQQKWVELSKGPCFGRCPVFTLTVYKNGWVSYKGENYTEKMGIFTRKLTRLEKEKLSAELFITNLKQYNDVYRSGNADLPTVTLTQFDGNSPKTVLGKDGRPEPVLKLEELLDKIASAGAWEQQETYYPGVPRNVIANQMLVQLHEGVDIQVWVRQYARFKMESKEQINAGNNYWLIQYDEKTNPPREMLTALKNDKSVVGVEFNRRTETR